MISCYFKILSILQMRFPLFLARLMANGKHLFFHHGSDQRGAKREVMGVVSSLGIRGMCVLILVSTTFLTSHSVLAFSSSDCWREWNKSTASDWCGNVRIVAKRGKSKWCRIRALCPVSSYRSTCTEDGETSITNSWLTAYRSIKLQDVEMVECCRDRRGVTFVLPGDSGNGHCLQFCGSPAHLRGLDGLEPPEIPD